MSTEATLGRLLDEAKVLADDRPFEVGHLTDWSLDAEDMIRRLVKAFNEQPAQPQQEPVPTECRRDGRCQYAIDNGIEGLSLGFPQPAQPQQEPVAEDNSNYRLDPPGLDPRYTSPPAQRKPLTDQEIRAIVREVDKEEGGIIHFARAIEAAHGIEEKNT